MASQIHIDGYLVDDKGTWTVRARFADTIDGKRSLHSKSTGLKVKGNNKRKAEAMMRDIVSEWERQANNARPADNPKMRDCIVKWLERKRLTIRANTLASYNVAAKAHIIPELGDIRICDISRQQIQRYYEKLQRDGVSANTMKKHRVIINGVLKDAVLDDVISVNVSEYVSLPKAKRFEGKALSEAQVADLLTALEKQAEPIRSVITLALVYGLRRSEICGLRWKDIDFQNNVIHIRNTVTEYSGVIYEAETTKTKAGCRDLYLIQSTTEYLASLQQKQKASRIYGEKVCVYSDGRTVKPEYITRASKRFLTACGYDDIRLHDLRATAATILAKRVPIKQVKEHLGHEDVHTTLTYYDHVRNEDRIATSNAMDNFLMGAGFASSCSESCSESGETDTDKVIFIDTILPKKLAIT